MEKLVGLLEAVKRRMGSAQYDSRVHPAESYYASIYMDYFKDHISRVYNHTDLKVFDAGCGTGRFSIPLAEMGCNVDAIDVHKDSLRIAKESADRAGVQVSFTNGDLQRELEAVSDQVYDVVLSIETLYVCKAFKEILRDLCRVTKKDGLMFVTHRTPFFYITQALRNNNYDDAVLVQKASEGRLLKGMHRIYYNWQTSEEVDQLYRSIGASIVRRYPIGPFSGFSSDAMSAICNTEEISKTQREKLRRIEASTKVREETLMASRYVLVVAQVG